ncbi:hypothetical protein FQN57_007129 [Myotisia sp. PD_48]|nr:hypothetical protein FQN57_007129 [Myotisia sp. PD_48]
MALSEGSDEPMTEPSIRYEQGGYHPVALGDVFKNGRYKIYHKLGYGGYSTVWLAKDTHSTTSKEACRLQALNGSKYVVKLFDQFIHHGPNGSHLCLVLELLGLSLSNILYMLDEYRLTTDTILKLTKQLLEAISYIHESGFAHGEDLSPRNLAFSSTRLANLSHDDIFKVLGEITTEYLGVINNRYPEQLIEAAMWDEWMDDEDEDIRVLDFGESFRQGEEPERLFNVPKLKAPELFFTNKFDYRVDLWVTGLMIYVLIFGDSPFKHMVNENAFIQQMIGFVEDLPSEWQQKWKEISSSNCLEDSKSIVTLLENVNLTRSKLDADFEDIDDIDLKILLPVIKGLVRFRPSDRISASQALKLLEHGNGI